MHAVDTKQANVVIMLFFLANILGFDSFEFGKILKCASSNIMTCAPSNILTEMCPLKHFVLNVAPQTFYLNVSPQTF